MVGDDYIVEMNLELEKYEKKPLKSQDFDAKDSDFGSELTSSALNNELHAFSDLHHIIHDIITKKLISHGIIIDLLLNLFLSFHFII